MAAIVQPCLCLLSAARTESLPFLRGTIAELRSRVPGLPILVGGVIFRHDPTLASSTGATAVGIDAAEAVDQVHRLLGL